MTEQTQREMIKSLAYGMTAQEMATSYGITPEDAAKFADEHANEIADKKNQLAREGWN